MTDAAEMSKSAKKRAAKKARDEKAAAESAPPAPEPAAKAKAKAAAAPASAPVSAPAKASPKMAATSEPAAKPKAKTKTKEAAQAAPAPAPTMGFMGAPVAMDDGTGGDWEVMPSESKKKEKQKQQKEAKAQEAKAAAEAKAVEEAKAAAETKAQAAAAAKAATAKASAGYPKAAAKGGAKATAAPPQAKAAAAPTATVPPTTEGPKSDADAPEPAAPKAFEFSRTINVPEGKIGIVIGPKGAKIKLIQEKTGVGKIDTLGQVFTISGDTEECVIMAEGAIKELIEKGYMRMSYEDFVEDEVNAPPSSFPDIIGKQGATIRKLKDELGVEVTIPTVPKDSPAGKKYKVAIVGEGPSVAKAKEVINDIMMYGHHELTHPGQVHKETHVEQWKFSFIIGKGGSEMRHIQNSYRVRVNIPREHSMNQNIVIVGEQVDVDRAFNYVEKLLGNADTIAKGRDRDGDDGGGKGRGKGKDDWEREDGDEPWMKQYLKKR